MASEQMVWGIGKLAKNQLIHNPAGTWSFVGSVPAKLAYCQADGSVPTQEQLDTAAHCGPGLAKLRTRCWTTKQAALDAAERN